MTYLAIIVLALSAVPLAIAYRVATGCRHHWETFKSINIWSGGKHPVGVEYHQSCTKCGALRKRQYIS